MSKLIYNADMKYFDIIVLSLVLWPFLSYGAVTNSKNITVSEGESFINLSQKFVEIEKEYENSQRIIDTTFSKGFMATFDYRYGLSFADIQINTRVSYLYSGESSASFDRDLGLKKTERDGIRFITNPTIELMKKFKNITPFVEHFLKIGFTASIKSDEHQVLNDRNSYTLNYIFSHATEDIIWAGEIFTNYFAEVESYNSTVGVEKRSAFTEVGFTLYPSFLFGSFTFIPLAGYSSTTDYDTDNRFFSRLSDKGFSYFAGLEFRYATKSLLLSLEYKVSSMVFNSISDDLDRKLDNEIESSSLAFSLGVPF